MFRNRITIEIIIKIDEEVGSVELDREEIGCKTYHQFYFDEKMPEDFTVLVFSFF
jgi:hypothetical protein